MIADLHCHYPMHLLPDDPAAVGPDPSWTEEILAIIEAGAIGVLSNILNDRYWDSGWRVSLDGLEAGKAGIVCSVLYWPQAEFDLTLYGKPPLPAYYPDIQHQIAQVEADLLRLDPTGQRVIVARTAQDLEGHSRGASTWAPTRTRSTPRWAGWPNRESST